MAPRPLDQNGTPQQPTPPDHPAPSHTPASNPLASPSVVQAGEMMLIISLVLILFVVLSVGLHLYLPKLKHLLNLKLHQRRKQEKIQRHSPSYNQRKRSSPSWLERRSVRWENPSQDTRWKTPRSWNDTPWPNPNTLTTTLFTLLALLLPTMMLDQCSATCRPFTQQHRRPVCTRYTTLGERHIKQSVSYKLRKHRYPTNRDSTKNV